MAQVIRIEGGRVFLLRIEERRKALFGDASMDEVAARLEAGESIDDILKQREQPTEAEA